MAYSEFQRRHAITDMSEAVGPRFLLIGEDVGDCMVRYCFEKARYWAVWKGMMTVERETGSIKRAVCSTHREEIEGRSWGEVSEMFRYKW
jgi:hypothetical protein